MIGRLRGTLLEKQPPALLLDVAGVAYEVQASMSTFYRLPDVGHETVLHTHFVVREDAQQLYGFSELQERALFRSLIKVNGVGPKMALTLLSSIEPDRFVRCIHDNDSAALVRLPGVGKKTAERLIIEMRDRLADWCQDALPLDNNNANAGTASALTDHSMRQDAVSALIALGYKAQEANLAITRVFSEDKNRESLIRLALRHLSGG